MPKCDHDGVPEEDCDYCCNCEQAQDLMREIEVLKQRVNIFRQEIEDLRKSQRDYRVNYYPPTILEKFENSNALRKENAKLRKRIEALTEAIKCLSRLVRNSGDDTANHF